MTDAENNLKVEEQAQETQEIETGDPAQTEQVTDDTQPSSEVSETEALEAELSEAETEQEQERIAFKLKNKFKAKATAAEATAEELKRELDAAKNEAALLKAAMSGDKKTLTLPDQFDYDSDEEYQKDLEAFYSAKSEETARRIVAEEKEAERQRAEESKRSQYIQEVEEKHINRAAKFIQNSKIDDETYSEAQAKVANTFGDQFLVNIMEGYENSEQVIWDLGRNPQKMQEFVEKFQKSPLATYSDFTRYADSLGKVQLPTTTEPDEAIERSASGVTDFQAKLDAMRQNGVPMTERIALKREAEAAGVEID